MIRKDVVLGMSIGGVLLALVVVYVVIQKTGRTAAPGVNPGVAQAEGGGLTNDPQPSPAADPPRPIINDITHPAGPTGPAATPGKTTGSPKPDDSWSARLYGKLDPRNTLEQNGMLSQTPSAPAAPIAPAAPAGADPSNAAPATGSAPARTHVIQKNETLSSIAAVVYGSANYYPYLLRANPTLDPTRLKPGATINIPDISEVRPAVPTGSMSGPSTGPSTRPMAALAPDVVIDPAREYVVESGDSLHKIALKLYGKVAMVDKIYELNKEAIGPDKARLRLHMVLKLPQPPVATPATQQ
jgi:LysM repeat protein